MTPYEMKPPQYRLIMQRFEPVLFRMAPFYYEMGTMWGQCDGAGRLRGHNRPGGWTYRKNSRLYAAHDPALSGANSAVNIILPSGGMTPELCESFLRPWQARGSSRCS